MPRIEASRDRVWLATTEKVDTEYGELSSAVENLLKAMSDVEPGEPDRVAMGGYSKDDLFEIIEYQKRLLDALVSFTTQHLLKNGYIRLASNRECVLLDHDGEQDA